MTYSESAAGIFQPEVMLPAQYFDERRPHPFSPELRLMLAVLQEAVGTVFKYRGDPRPVPSRLLRDAEQWIAARNMRWPFAFENICAALHLDADCVRRGLLSPSSVDAAVAPPTRAASILPSRRVAGRRHKVGLIQSHRKAAG